MRPCRHVSDRGFTLVELMTVVAILIVSLSLAAPMLRGFVQGQRVKAISQDLMSDLLLARSEALTRNAAVDVAPAGADWSGGWTVRSGGQTLASRSGEAGSATLEGAPAVGSQRHQTPAAASSPSTR